MTDSNISSDVAGGPVRHIPVMLDEVLDCLGPSAGNLFVDGTFGAGGYTGAILATGARVIAIDRDPDAIEGGQELCQMHPSSLRLVEGEFADLDEIVAGEGEELVDGVVLDIGVSSMQLDEAERGFSFRQDGPLDMRMARSGVSAADVVNHAEQQDLTRIIGLLGEERKASQISRAIVKARMSGTIRTTLQLANIVESAVHRKPQDKIHPATRTFQALRIFINRELDQLCSALMAAERVLKAGGRLVVVTFHSLEDRIVKQFFKDRSGTQQGSRHMPAVADRERTFELRGNGLVKPGRAETELNPRARSAKLRYGIRTPAQPREANATLFGLPNLANPQDYAQAEAG